MKPGWNNIILKNNVKIRVNLFTNILQNDVDPSEEGNIATVTYIFMCVSFFFEHLFEKLMVIMRSLSGATESYKTKPIVSRKQVTFFNTLISHANETTLRL